MHVVVGIAFNVALRDEIIERGHSRRGVNVTGGEGGASGVPCSRAVGVGDKEFAARDAEWRWQGALCGIVVVPERQRPAGIAGHLADDPLKPVEIHAMPAPEEMSSVLAGVPCGM